MQRMSGRPAERHISAQEFCKNCRARHSERGRAWLHQWIRCFVVCPGAESETRNPVTSARCLDDTIPRPRQILYNSEIGTFSNTFFHSPQGLPQLKRHIYLEARLSLLVPVSQAIVRPSLLSIFRSQFFPKQPPWQKNSLEFSPLLSNQTRFSGCTPTVQRQLLF